MSTSVRQPLLSRSRSNEESTPSSTTDQYGSGGHDQYDKNSGRNEYLLDDKLFPKDAYEDKTYWADLPTRERIRRSHRLYGVEANREVSKTRSMFRQSWISPVKFYLTNYAINGIGFSTEGYVLFSVGNIMPLFKSLYPLCWKDFVVCDEQMINAIKIMEILGIIMGQLVVGYIGDAIGTRWGLIQDVAIMLVGSTLLTAMWGATLSGWTIMYGISIFIFAFGVGGEYPMTSTSSMEKFQGRHDRLHRGRNVLLSFLMQGWGQLGNQILLMILVVLTNGSMSPPYTEAAVQITFRVTFGVSVVSALYFLYLRVRYIKPSPNAASSKETDRSWGTTKLFVRHYWHRILASTVCWFCSDYAFYGLQIFRNQLLELVLGVSSTNAKPIYTHNLINIGCQLVGYYLAALLIDHKNYGRRRMQLVGFAAMSLLLGIMAGAFGALNQPGIGGKVFQALFYLTNFWVQFGPNSTTFLVAGEVFPKAFRSTAHGLAAACGKCGALAATVSYSYIDSRSKFAFAAAFSIIGFIVTAIFVADTTGMDLAEQQRYWRAVVEGEEERYHGVAINPIHLSRYERIVLKRGDNYDPGQDKKAKIAELRREYFEKRSDSDDEEDFPADDKKTLENVRKYFELEQAS